MFRAIRLGDDLNARIIGIEIAVIAGERVSKRHEFPLASGKGTVRGAKQSDVVCLKEFLLFCGGQLCRVGCSLIFAFDSLRIKEGVKRLLQAFDVDCGEDFGGYVVIADGDGLAVTGAKTYEVVQ